MAFLTGFFCYLGFWSLEDREDTKGQEETIFNQSLMREKRQRPAGHPKSEKKKKFQSRDRDANAMIKVPVLSPAKAKIKTEEATSYLREKGFTFNKPENLHKALIPDVNLGLALTGDKAQALILADQWAKDGGRDNNFFQQHVFQPVGTNDYQGDMAIKHHLDKFIFTIAESSEDSSSECSSPKFKPHGPKTLADTIEALMGAIRQDGDTHWEQNVARFMKMFELDFDAAIRYRQN